MYTYTANVTQQGPRIGHVQCGNGWGTIFSAPPEFNGKSDIATPEDFFVASIASCFMLTFETLVNKMNITVDSFTCSVESTLEETEGKERMSNVVIRPKVVGKDVRKIDKALHMAERYCLIIRSLDTNVRLEPSIESSEN
jgi:organic hydroperoxide reductase OsmC/OhrA